MPLSIPIPEPLHATVNVSTPRRCLSLSQKGKPEKPKILGFPGCVPGGSILPFAWETLVIAVTSAKATAVKPAGGEMEEEQGKLRLMFRVC